MSESRALRVLMVSPQFRPLLGGYERSAERLSGGLAARGIRVLVVTERRRNDWPRTESVDGFEIRRLWCVARAGWHGPTSLLSLCWFLLLHVRRFDVVHVHQYGWPAAVAVSIARIFGRPVVLKLTNTGPDGLGGTLEKSRAARWLKALHRSASAFAAVSEKSADEAILFGIPEERVRRIGNGVDTRVLHPASAKEKHLLRRSLGVGGDACAVFVGRLSPEKGPLLLLDAWERVARKRPNARLWILGDGPDLEAVTARVRSGCLAASVRVLGSIPEPLPWYQSSDVFVLPSLNEGLSNSLLEALACGLPVVSTRVSGSEDIFAAADVGELVPVGDAGALADALDRLLGNGERRERCGAAARALVERHYSLSRIVNDFETLYRELAGRPEGPDSIPRHHASIREVSH